jgi:hypothetical protein
MQDNLILSFVGGRVGESHTKDIAHLVSLRGYKDYPRSYAQNALGAVDVDRPSVLQIWEFGQLCFGPLGDEVWKDL